MWSEASLQWEFLELTAPKSAVDHKQKFVLCLHRIHDSLRLCDPLGRGARPPRIFTSFFLPWCRWAIVFSFVDCSLLFCRNVDYFPEAKCSREGRAGFDPGRAEEGIQGEFFWIRPLAKSAHSLRKLRVLGPKLGVWVTSVGVGGGHVKSKYLAQNDQYLIVNECLGWARRAAFSLNLKVDISE